MHDVTQGQWQAVMGRTRATSRVWGRNRVKDIYDEELKLFPVERCRGTTRKRSSRS